MITVLKHIKGYNKVESLQIMLEVIEVLEKNFAHDEEINSGDWLVLFTWLEKYYCELKLLYSIHRGLEQK
jgi:hypothetical protein